MRQYVKKYKVDSLTGHFYLTRRSWIILSLQSGPYVPVPLVLFDVILLTAIINPNKEVIIAVVIVSFRMPTLCANRTKQF